MENINGIPNSNPPPYTQNWDPPSLPLHTPLEDHPPPYHDLPLPYHDLRESFFPVEIMSQEKILEGLKASHRANTYPKIAYNTLALCAGTAFGVFSSLALVGIMVNPVGFAVSASLIALALVIAGGHSGMKGIRAASVSAFSGFVGGFLGALNLNVVAGVAFLLVVVPQIRRQIPLKVFRESGINDINYFDPETLETITNNQFSYGILIKSLKSGESVLKDGGVRINDIILRYDRKSAIYNLKRYIEVSDHQTIKLKVWRDGRAIDIVLNLKEFDEKIANIARAKNIRD